MRPAVVVVAVGLIAVGATASACSKDSNQAEGRPRRTTTTERETTTTTLDPVEAEKQAVIAAYDAALQAETDSTAAPESNPDDPAIAATHTGPMLSFWVAQVTGYKREGSVSRLPENSVSRHEVESVSFGEDQGQQVAYLEVCTVGDGEQVIVATGAVVSTGGVDTVQSTNAMVNEDGVWKLAEQRVNSRWEGVAGCAAG
jgi:hypothetical protein